MDHRFVPYDAAKLKQWYNASYCDKFSAKTLVSERKCDECGRWFQRKGALDKHICLRPDQPFVLGTTSSDLFPMEPLLIPEPIMEPGVDPKLVCPDLEVKRPRLSLNPLACTLCGMEFKSKRELTNHEARHSTVKTFRCSECLCAYTTKASLDLHIVRKHGAINYTCNVCKREFSMKCDFDQHLRRALHRRVRLHK
jgi:C2H2-type zinc finger protein